MPRDLGDVLHYLLPEAKPVDGSGTRQPASPPSPAQESTRSIAATPRRSSQALAPLPIVAVPVGDRDVVRGALVWNLGFEIVRLGSHCSLVVPEQDRSSPLWPTTESANLGAELVVSDASEIGSLYHAALDVAVQRAADCEEGGVVLVRVPPHWLLKTADAGRLLNWTLLLTSSEPRDLVETYGLAKLLHGARRRVGVTVHGARGLDEAREAFSRLAQSVERRLGCQLTSYGLMVDDLDVYRAIVAQRPIGLAHPQSPAARTLSDVAELLLDDARTLRVA